MSVYDCTRDDSRDEGLDAAVAALARGELVVLPTDTVYGIAAGAFDPAAVTALLTAKGRGRHKPPPVLVASTAILPGLSTDVADAVHDLVEAFWPGPLTIICHAQPTLAWDLGETGGTVALRMPDDEITLTLLGRTGPLAVSSANRSGGAPATTVLAAAAALGDAVGVYLDGGPSRGAVVSTIVDATGPVPRIVRHGALTLEELAAVVPELASSGAQEAAAEPGGPDAAESGSTITPGEDCPAEPVADPVDEPMPNGTDPLSPAGTDAPSLDGPDEPAQGGAGHR